MLTGEQVRAARAARGWSLRDLALAVGRKFPDEPIAYPTIAAFENGADSRADTLRRLQVTLEREGVRFANTGFPGVSWDAEAPARWAAADAKSAKPARPKAKAKRKGSKGAA